ncbi:uncharacterized protein LOC128240548 [Mya arenaria]|uniref:uncharacterized protein LOC128240548 n=1 Tax=Mya arenaria TaxID=6604 RepID=UPI0022E8861F|nr:uncharacterized protein LOC128240548 [Mya arenaria]
MFHRRHAIMFIGYINVVLVSCRLPLHKNGVDSDIAEPGSPYPRLSVPAGPKDVSKTIPEAEKEILLSPGKWPSFVHHCTQAKEIWVQYHQLLPQFGLRLNEDTLRIEKEFLSNFNNEFVNFAFVGLTPSGSSSISKMISNNANLATIVYQAKSRSEDFKNICSQNQIAPLVIISHVGAEKSAFLYAEKYRYASKPERDCVVVVVCENKQCSHNKRDLNRLITYTCERNVTMIQREISILLKRWTYRILAQRINAMKILLDSMNDCQLPSPECIQQLCVHGIEKEVGAVQHIDDRICSVRKLKELLNESRALYSRNHIPPTDFPDFPPELRRPNEKMLKQISKSDYVIGCGDRFGTLLILVDEEIENRETFEEKLIAELKFSDLGNGDVEFKYVSKGLRYFLKSGETIFVKNDKSYGTLAGFATQDNDSSNEQGNVFALFSRHVAVCCSNSKLKVQDEIVGEVLPSDGGCIDIAAAKIYSHLVESCDNTFVTEENTEKTSVTFDPNTEDISLPGTLVHLVGAASEEIGLGKITVTKYFSEQTQEMNTFLIENRVSNTHVFCEPGDSGAMILSYLPDDDKLVAIGMLIGSFKNKNDDKTDAFANPFPPNRKKHRATYAADELYSAFYLKDGLNELSKIHGKQFRLFGENNNTYSCKGSNKCDGAFAVAN